MQTNALAFSIVNTLGNMTAGNTNFIFPLLFLLQWIPISKNLNTTKHSHDWSRKTQKETNEKKKRIKRDPHQIW